MVDTVGIPDTWGDSQAPVRAFRQAGVPFVHLAACVNWFDFRPDRIKLLYQSTGEPQLGVGSSGADPLLLVELVRLFLCDADYFLFRVGGETDGACHEHDFVLFHPRTYLTLFLALKRVTCNSAWSKIHRQRLHVYDISRRAIQALKISQVLIPVNLTLVQIERPAR